MKKIAQNIFIIILLSLSISGGKIIAQSNSNDYVTLAPLPNTTSCQTGSGKDCKTTLAQYLPAIFNLSIGIAAVLAFAVITFGGITYVVSDSISGKADGRKHIENALWGLVLVIAAYAILYTINPAILEFNLNLPKPAIITESTVTVGGSTGGVTNPVLPSGVTMKSGVDLTGIQQGTLDGLAALQSSCNCTLLVTSGTEGSHTTNSAHYSGNAVDLSPNQSINSSLGAPSSPTACSTFSTPSGGTLLWEPAGSTCGGTVASNADHWHASF